MPSTTHTETIGRESPKLVRQEGFCAVVPECFDIYVKFDACKHECPSGAMVARLTTISRHQEVAGSSPVLDSLFVPSEMFLLIGNIFVLRSLRWHLFASERDFS
jgi:hypothetical protein